MSLTPPAASPRELRLILGALMLTLLLAALDQTIVATALPTISSDLGGLASLSWVVTAYLLASTASTPLWGKLSDIFGRKPMLQASVVVFVVGSALAGVSQSMIQLIGSRTIQGLGGGGILVLVLTVIADLVPPRERGRYAGMFGAAFGLASIVGPVLGGFLTQQLSWRWIFYINLPLAVIALAVLGAVLRLPSRRTRRPIDWVGASLFVVGVVMLLLALVWTGHPYDWNSPQIVGLLVGGLCVLTLFVLHELRTPEPMVPMSLFSNRVFRLSVVVGFIVGFTMLGTIIFLSLYLQVVRGATPSQSGLQLLPFVFGILITSVASGRVITRTGRYRIFPITGTAIAAVGLLLLTRLGVDDSYGEIAVGMFILGAGLGNVMQVITVAMQNTIEPENLGSATSASTFFRSMGSSFGAAGFGAVLGISLSVQLEDAAIGTALEGIADGTTSLAAIQALPDSVQDVVVAAFAHATGVVFLAAVPVMLVAFVLTLMLPEIRLRKAGETEHVLADGPAPPLPVIE